MSEEAKVEEVVETVKVRVGKEVLTVPVVTSNCKTVWVRLSDGNLIKRHKVKHVA